MISKDKIVAGGEKILTCFVVLKAVLSGGTCCCVGTNEKAESSHGLPYR